VRSTLGDLTGRLTSWKGPPNRDAKLLADNGARVIAGFVAGMEGQYGSVRSSLRGLTADLPRSLAPDIGMSVSAPTPAWAARLIALLDGGLSITLDSAGGRGDDALLELIRDRVRVKGGRGTVLGITS